jgi:hypothetical protein
MSQGQTLTQTQLADQLDVLKLTQTQLADQLGVPSHSRKAVIVEHNQGVEVGQVLEQELDPGPAQEQELDPRNNIQELGPHLPQLLMVRILAIATTPTVPGVLTLHIPIIHIPHTQHMVIMELAVDHPLTSLELGHSTAWHTLRLVTSLEMVPICTGTPTALVAVMLSLAQCMTNAIQLIAAMVLLQSSMRAVFVQGLNS